MGNRCMFCGSGKPTREHVSGKWLKKYAGNFDSPAIKTAHTVSGSDGKPRPGFMDRPGSPLAQTSRVVCAGCNNGWMSRIEKAMERIFPSLLAGDTLAWTAGEWDVLERWVTLKLAIIARGCLEGETGAKAMQVRERAEGLWRQFATDQVGQHEVLVFRCRELRHWGGHNHVYTALLEPNGRMHLHDVSCLVFGPLLLVCQRRCCADRVPIMLRAASMGLVPATRTNAGLRGVVSRIDLTEADRLLRSYSQTPQDFRPIGFHPRDSSPRSG